MPFGFILISSWPYLLMKKNLAIYVSKYSSGITLIRHIVYLFFYVVFIFLPVLLLSTVAFLVLKIIPEASVSVTEYELSHWGLSPSPGNSFYQIGWDTLGHSVLLFSKMDELHHRYHNISTDAFFLFFWLRRSHRGVEKTKSIHKPSLWERLRQR